MQGNRPTINRYMKCRKRRISVRQLEKKRLQISETERGSFGPLPFEVFLTKFWVHTYYTDILNYYSFSITRHFNSLKMLKIYVSHLTVNIPDFIEIFQNLMSLYIFSILGHLYNYEIHSSSFPWFYDADFKRSSKSRFDICT